MGADDGKAAELPRICSRPPVGSSVYLLLVQVLVVVGATVVCLFASTRALQAERAARKSIGRCIILATCEAVDDRQEVKSLY